MFLFLCFVFFTFLIYKFFVCFVCIIVSASCFSLLMIFLGLVFCFFFKVNCVVFCFLLFYINVLNFVFEREEGPKRAFHIHPNMEDFFPLTYLISLSITLFTILFLFLNKWEWWEGLGLRRNRYCNHIINIYNDFFCLCTIITTQKHTHTHSTSRPI